VSGAATRRAFDIFRSALFWSHLTAGAAAGLVVLIMSVTGVALAYQRQLLEWSARRHLVSASADESARLPLDSLLAVARAAAPERRVAGVTVRADPRMPLSVTLDDRSSRFLNPYTGEVLGDDARLRGFFATVERVHRSIVFHGTTRSETGTKVTGAANLGFLFLILSGLVLWWPRRLTARAFRGVLLFARAARGKARDWNWHHVLGIWSAPALVLIVASATFISYDWPQRLVERVAGAAVTQETGQRGGERRVRSDGGRSSAAARPVSLDTVWARATPEPGQWHAAQIRLPTEPGRPIVLTISETEAFRPDQRTTVNLDAATGAVLERRGYEELDAARRFRAWMRPLHTGEVAGIPGQTLAAVVSAAAAVMVWTGLALAWRRLRSALRRREQQASLQPSPIAAEAEG
jgi:uncharacterized iron-regulated membrane protein